MQGTAVQVSEVAHWPLVTFMFFYSENMRLTKYNSICASKILETNVHFQKEDVNPENRIFCF